MIRVAVVDDDPLSRRSLCRHFEQYSDLYGVSFEIREFSDGDEILENYQAGYDILFLDVMMNYTDGLKTAREIRLMDPEVMIFFASNMPQFASKGYEVDAMDYLLKPISYPDFEKRIQRALKNLQNRNQYLSIFTKSGFRKINVHELDYVEVRDHDLMFHTRSGILEAKGSLSDIEAQLNKETFFRCNKCYLINLDQVQGIQNCDVTVGGDLLQVSRARKKELLDALNHFLNR